VGLFSLRTFESTILLVTDLSIIPLRFVEEVQPSSLSSQVSPDNQATYEAQVAVMRQNDRSTLYVDFLHLESHDYLLADAIKQNHYRYESYLRKSIQNFVRKVDPSYVQEEVRALASDPFSRGCFLPPRF